MHMVLMSYTIRNNNVKSAKTSTVARSAIIASHTEFRRHLKTCQFKLAPVFFRWQRNRNFPVLHFQATHTFTALSHTHPNISQTFWHRLPIFQVDLHCVLHRVTTSSCRGHVDELATEPFLLLHREHGTGYRRSWNCCDGRTRFVVIWKHFCFILSTGTRIRIDSVIRTRSSSRGRNTNASVTVTASDDPIPLAVYSVRPTWSYPVWALLQSSQFVILSFLFTLRNSS